MVYSELLKGQIATQLGVRPETISAWQKNPEFQEALKEEMHRGFRSLATKARKKLERLMDSPNDGVALGACKEVLNKAGYMETQKVEQTIKDITLEVTD